MPTLVRQRVDVDESALLLRGVDPEQEWRPNVTTGDTVLDADTGKPVIIVRPYASIGSLPELRHALLNYPRGTTPRVGGQRNDSKAFGYAPRRVLMQRNACRCSEGLVLRPDLHATIEAAGVALSGLLRDEFPSQHEHDMRIARDAIRSEWRMRDTQFTSGVINRNSALAYHFDRNNLECWSAMVVVRRGARGGHLHVPAYDAVIACRDGDAVLFYGRDLLHGVTPMHLSSRDAYRISAVWYTVEAMKHCLEPSEEARRGMLKRTEREDTLLERQRAEGWIEEASDV